MTPTQYLEAVLASQTLNEDGPELAAIREHRDAVEKKLRERFPSPGPTIRYGGSKAKGTMILESYDLDIISYFENDDTSAGDTLEDIYNNVRKALEEDYAVQPKPSALRLRSREQVDFHIDVVPGRFTDDKKEDAFLYRSSGEKKRLKTNLQVHIDHVRDSGVIDALRLVKLWRVRNSLSVCNFVLELVAIEFLKPKKSAALDVQLKHFFSEMKDKADTVKPIDPANPEGNDLSDLLGPAARAELKSMATRALDIINSSGWEQLFGTVKTDQRSRIEVLGAAAASVKAPSKPWRK